MRPTVDRPSDHLQVGGVSAIDQFPSDQVSAGTELPSAEFRRRLHEIGLRFVDEQAHMILVYFRQRGQGGASNEITTFWLRFGALQRPNQCVIHAPG